jgi:dolichol-phosphate mannosyltransferase
MDADFSHRPCDLPRLLAALDTSDLAMGCRYVPGGGTKGWSMIRQLISRGGNGYARLLLNLHYRDLTGGFNAWRRRCLSSIDVKSLSSRGYAFQVELKYRAHRKGFALVEIPIQFDQRQYGESKMSGRIVWEAAFRVAELAQPWKRRPSWLTQEPETSAS